MKIKITFSVFQLQKTLQLLNEYKEFNSNDLVRFHLCSEIWKHLAKSLSDAMIERRIEVKVSVRMHEACLLSEFSNNIENQLIGATVMKDTISSEIKIKVL